MLRDHANDRAIAVATATDVLGEEGLPAARRPAAPQVSKTANESVEVQVLQNTYVRQMKEMEREMGNNKKGRSEKQEATEQRSKLELRNQYDQVQEQLVSLCERMEEAPAQPPMDESE